MGWLFGQIWFLCALAFLVGSAVTWATFVRPRRAVPPPVAVPPEQPPVPADPWPRREPEDEDPPPRVVDPALAALDSRDGPRRTARTGVAATGALDRLGVQAAGTPGRSAPESTPDGNPDIPLQAGPPEEEPR